MAKTLGEFQFTMPTRGCKVGDELGYFHCWEWYATVVSPGLTVGSHPGGQLSQIYGIVEFADRVERVEPTKIKFIDEESAALSELNKRFSKGG